MKERVLSMLATTGLILALALVVAPISRAFATGGGGNKPKCGGKNCPTYKEFEKTYCDDVKYDPAVHCTAPAGSTVSCACTQATGINGGCSCPK